MKVKQTNKFKVPNISDSTKYIIQGINCSVKLKVGSETFLIYQVFIRGENQWHCKLYDPNEKESHDINSTVERSAESIKIFQMAKKVLNKATNDELEINIQHEIHLLNESKVNETG